MQVQVCQCQWLHGKLCESSWWISEWLLLRSLMWKCCASLLFQPLRLIHTVHWLLGAAMAVFVVNDFTKEENRLFGNFIPNLDSILVNPKVTKVDLIVSSHMEASLNTPTNHTIIITQHNTIKHTGYHLKPSLTHPSSLSHQIDV